MGSLGDLFSAALGAGKSMLGDAANSTPIVPGNPMLDDFAQGNRLGALNIGMTGAAGALAAGRVAQGAYDTAATLPDVMDSFARGGGTAPVTQNQVAGVSDLASLFGGASAPVPKPVGSIGIFGGRNAATADLGMLDEAQALRSIKGQSGFEDVTPGSILADTGWHVGPDGKWRNEISDHGATLVPNIPQAGKLGDVLEHPDLYAAYPHLADVGFSTSSYNKSIYGNFDPRLNSIYLNPSAPDPMSVLLHEAQHAVQQREGFSFGAGPNEVGYDQYRRAAGEVEARNTQARMNLTDAERREIAPWQTQDVDTMNQTLNPRGRGETFDRAVHGLRPTLGELYR